MIDYNKSQKATVDPHGTAATASSWIPALSALLAVVVPPAYCEEAKSRQEIEH
jgi:hypothetical protein